MLRVSKFVSFPKLARSVTQAAALNVTRIIQIPVDKTKLDSIVDDARAYVNNLFILFLFYFLSYNYVCTRISSRLRQAEL